MSAGAVGYAKENAGRFLEELKTLLRIPSVSTTPEHKGDVEKAAQWVAAELKRIGMENVEVIRATDLERDGHPLVYADWLHAAGKPTVLCYAHYDVQPPDPLEEWVSPPFEPTERNGNLYARGAVDDKGQLVLQLKALESLMKKDGKLPINVRVIYEGEEEVGGERIAAFVREHPDRLKADFALISDTEMFAPELPTLCVGLRGMIYTELEVRGAKTDLHSGMYGGAAPNPFVALAQILAGLKDRDGKILIPGFYDDVAKPSADELKAWKALPFDEEEYREKEVGAIAAGWGARLLGDRADVGAADARCSRDRGRIHGRGREDGDPGEGDGEGVDAAGAGHDAGEGVQALSGIRGEDQAGGSVGGDTADPPGRADRDRDGQSVCEGGDEGAEKGVGEGHGVHPVGGIDPDCGRLRAVPEDSVGDDGLRAAGRWAACAEREVPHREFSSRD